VTTVVFTDIRSPFEPFGAEPAEYLFGHTAVVPDVDLVYLYGRFNIHPLLTKKINNVRQGWNYSIMTSDTTQLRSSACLGSKILHTSADQSLTCQFRHQHDTTMPAVFAEVHTFWQKFTSTSIVCMLPDAVKRNPQDFIPSVTVAHRTVTGREPLRVVAPARSNKHLVCACLTLLHRWKFLLEFLAYHTKIHGLGHTIVLSQDEDTGKAADWLRTLYSIEVVYWPYPQSQASMQAYCTVLARQSCSWVAQWDIDEFVALADMRSLPLLLLSASEFVAALEFPRYSIQMHALGEPPLRTKPGGVLRRYTCRIPKMHNVKALLRISNLHPSFANGVHHFCHLPTTVSEFRSKDQLLHYRFQSWELYRERYVHNVNFDTAGKSLADYPLDKPERE
jgi:hypothetical protein